MSLVDFTAYRHPVLAVACPSCRAAAGAWCVRPSEHRTFGKAFHAERKRLADEVHERQGSPAIENTTGGRRRVGLGIWRYAAPSNTLPRRKERIVQMGSHPNRSKTNIRAGQNPTPAQVRAGREELVKLIAPEKAEDLVAGRELAGGLVYASWRAWQNWELESDAAEHRRMHAATWELFQVKLAALKLLRDREISPALLRELGIFVPAVKEKA